MTKKRWVLQGEQVILIIANLENSGYANVFGRTQIEKGRGKKKSETEIGLLISIEIRSRAQEVDQKTYQIPNQVIQLAHCTFE